MHLKDRGADGEFKMPKYLNFILIFMFSILLYINIYVNEFIYIEWLVFPLFFLVSSIFLSLYFKYSVLSGHPKLRDIKKEDPSMLLMRQS